MTFFLVLIILFFVITLSLFLMRKSTDISLIGDILIIRYPLKKEMIELSGQLCNWQLQEIRMIRIGKVSVINIELRDGKWKNVSSRFTGEGFPVLLKYLNDHYPELRQKDW